MGASHDAVACSGDQAGVIARQAVSADDWPDLVDGTGGSLADIPEQSDAALPDGAHATAAIINQFAGNALEIRVGFE